MIDPDMKIYKPTNRDKKRAPKKGLFWLNRLDIGIRADFAPFESVNFVTAKIILFAFESDIFVTHDFLLSLIIDSPSSALAGVFLSLNFRWFEIGLSIVFPSI